MPESEKNNDLSNPEHSCNPVRHEEAATFDSLGLSAFFVDRLKERNIVHPTEIQQKVIPRLLAGESFIFRSATGTGKTFAYLLPLLERLVSLLGDGDKSAASVLRGKPLLVVAAPTFELCSQIKSEADFLLKAAPVHTALLIGSAAPGRQIEALKRDRPEVIVGNPGRILVLARQGKLKLRNVRFLVLDEGDRLVHDELFEETREMVSLLKSSLQDVSLQDVSIQDVPLQNAPFQSAACSATLPAKSRQRLLPLLGIREGLCSEDSLSDVLREKVEHWAFFSPEREKMELLRSLLAALETAVRKGGGRKAPPAKVLIFTGRGNQTENIAARLRSHKLPAAALSGGMDKTMRKQALDAFRSGQVRFLVSSDLAARGLDIADISHVIALDVSEDRDVYLHRAGRTARAGKSGVMISIGTEGEMRRLAALEKNLGLTVYPKVLYGGRILAPEDQQDF